MLPSISHSQAAAIDPIIEDKTSEFVTFNTKLEYAKSASPDPTASRTSSEKEPTENLSLPLFLFEAQKTPLAPSFKIKFLYFDFLSKEQLMFQL